jgi:hypothetical protein
MITYETLLKIGLTLQKAQRRSLDLYQNYKIDLFDYEDDYQTIITTCLKEIFNEEQYEWFEWFCYENDFGQKGMKATDKDGNIICQSWEQLYEILKEYET